MAYVTGDIHGDPRDLLRFREAHSLTADDTVIILVDVEEFAVELELLRMPAKRQRAS